MVALVLRMRTFVFIAECYSDHAMQRRIHDLSMQRNVVARCTSVMSSPYLNSYRAKLLREAMKLLRDLYNSPRDVTQLSRDVIQRCFA